MSGRIEFDPTTVEAIAAGAHDLWAVAAYGDGLRVSGDPRRWGEVPEADRESSRASVRAVLNAIVDRELAGGATGDDAVLLLAATKAAAVHPGVLRWCDWPGCFANFHAVDGPGRAGWMRHRAVTLLLCPEHDAAGHVPSFTWDLDRGSIALDAPPAERPHMDVACTCGETGQVRPQNIEAVRAWWRQHVTALAPAVA